MKNIKEINKSFKITLQDTLIYELDVDSFKYSLISCIVTPGKHFAILKHFQTLIQTSAVALFKLPSSQDCFFFNHDSMRIV